MNYGRNPLDILLLAVSKKQAISQIKDAYKAGIKNFGENYWQEARDKINALHDLDIIWHYIGSLQSNKAKYIAKSFDWVHTIDNEKIAEKLNDARKSEQLPLNVCIQLNFGKDNKSAGISPDNCINLVKFMQHLENLQLRGLMIIPAIMDPKDTYDTFLQVQLLLESINKELGTSMDTLSMGMSRDFELAIKAGSTIVRIGTNIFGERK